jgi:signal transduction histidine kinase
VIEAGCALQESEVVWWVQDTGPGIPPESREKVFEKYSRLQTDRYPKGIGLGLAFCRLAVLAHGGRIWVESPAGSGSRFIFTLPVNT